MTPEIARVRLLIAKHKAEEAEWSAAAESVEHDQELKAIALDIAKAQALIIAAYQRLEQLELAQGEK